jgi:hypothetical protein
VLERLLRFIVSTVLPRQVRQRDSCGTIVWRAAYLCPHPRNLADARGALGRKPCRTRMIVWRVTSDGAC